MYKFYRIVNEYEEALTKPKEDDPTTSHGIRVHFLMNEANNGVKNLKWTLSMARTNDPHSASSQFFINLVNNTSLDHTEETVQGWGYAVFGEVVEGFETVEAIAAVATGSSGFHQDVPIDEVSIIDTSVTQEK